MSIKDDDFLARAAIEQCVTTLKELSGSKPICAKWRKWLDAELGAKKKRGRPIVAKVADRDRAVAGAMLAQYLAIENGAETEKITAFAENLVEKYAFKGRNYGVKEIFTAYKKYEVDVMAAEIARRLNAGNKIQEEKRQEIYRAMRERLHGGELADTVITETSAALRNLDALEE